MLSAVQVWSLVPSAEILTVVFGSAATAASCRFQRSSALRVALDGHAGVVEHDGDVAVVGGERRRFAELAGKDL